MMKFVVFWVSLFVFCSCGVSSQSSGLDSSRRSNRSEVAKPDFSSVGNRPITENNRFPIRPNLTLTPGDLCDHADEYRYPERINYCNRNVDAETKAQIFVMYDQELGFETRKMERNTFKIDHLIPLCMGGSNKEDNLWPQYQAVYEYTDPVEPYLCDLMSIGRLKQSEAVKLILEIKKDPTTAPQRMKDL